MSFLSHWRDRRRRRPMDWVKAAVARITDAEPTFFCPGCRRDQARKGAEVISRPDGQMVTVCATCIPISKDEQAELHQALDQLTDLRNLNAP